MFDQQNIYVNLIQYLRFWILKISPLQFCNGLWEQEAALDPINLIVINPSKELIAQIASLSIKWKIAINGTWAGLLKEIILNKEVLRCG